MKQQIKVDFDFDFKLLGIVTPIKDYVLISRLNKSTGLDLVEEDDVEIISKENKSSFFSKYAFIDDEIEIIIVSNKHQNGFLIPELKEVDYFSICFIPDLKWNEFDLKSKLNKILGVQLAYDIDISKLKSKQNLIFE